MGLHDTGDPIRMLIIDDDEVLLSALPWPIWRRLPHVVIETASSPEAALAHILAGTYDIVLSDIRMPRMDGVTLLQKVKGYQPDTPVILFTGSGEAALRREANLSGAYAFILKPLDPSFLVEVVKKAVYERRFKLAMAERTT